MSRTVLLLIFIVSFWGIYAQKKVNPKLNKKQPIGVNQNATGNTDKTVTDLDKKPPIELYKIISINRDTTFVDTTLTIQKDYRYNYLRKDDFELLPFANVGKPYNRLAYTFNRSKLLPFFAAQARHFSYKEVDDIYYYEVPTPLTELYFKTAFRQGQQMDAFFTVNTSKEFNIALGYTGVRSLGFYQNSLTSTDNFWMSTNYHTKNNRYFLRAHLTSQDILNEENGGLNANSLQLFIDDNPEFTDRGRLDVNFEDAETLLKGNRIFIDNEYVFITPDSISKTKLSIGNTIHNEIKRFTYSQDKPFAAYGDSYKTEGLNKRTSLDRFSSQLYTRFSNSILGSITGYVDYTKYKYGYNSVLLLDSQTIPNKLSGNLITVGGTYKKNYKGFELYGEGSLIISGGFTGNFLRGAASYELDEKNKITAGLQVKSAAPDFNFLLYQSDYQNFNWLTNFKNVKTQTLDFALASKTFGNASVSYTGIDDYTYFAVKPNDSTPTPHQYSERINYLKIKAEKEVRYKKFRLLTTVMYQQVLGGEDVFNVPQILTRNSLYYQDEWFKKALFLQTGVTVNYFTAYRMNAYQPVLGEFYVQNNTKIGGFPLVSIFFNAKVRQTRIYFKYENLTGLFSSKKDYFSAPGYPYRDPVLRFGLVWNFFL